MKVNEQQIGYLAMPLLVVVVVVVVVVGAAAARFTLVCDEVLGFLGTGPSYEVSTPTVDVWRRDAGLVFM